MLLAFEDSEGGSDWTIDLKQNILTFLDVQQLPGGSSDIPGHPTIDLKETITTYLDELLAEGSSGTHSNCAIDLGETITSYLDALLPVGASGIPSNYATNPKETIKTNRERPPPDGSSEIPGNPTIDLRHTITPYPVLTVPDWSPRFKTTDTAVPPPRRYPKFVLPSMDLSPPDGDPKMSGNFTTHLKQTMMTDLMIRPANEDSEVSVSDEDSEIRSNCPTDLNHPIYGKHGTNPAPYIPGVEKGPGVVKTGELICSWYIITLGTKMNCPRC